MERERERERDRSKKVVHINYIVYVHEVAVPVWSIIGSLSFFTVTMSHIIGILFIKLTD